MAAAEEAALSSVFCSSGKPHVSVPEQQLRVLGITSEMPFCTTARQGWIHVGAGSNRAALLQHLVRGFAATSGHSEGIHEDQSVIRCILAFLKHPQKYKILPQKYFRSTLHKAGSLSRSQRSYISTLLNTPLILELL